MFGKGDWKTANHFPSFDSFMSAILFHISLSFSSLIRIQKEKKLQNKLSKEKSHVQQEKIVFAEPQLYSQRLGHITSGICRQFKRNLTTLHQRCVMFDFFRFKFTYLSGKRSIITFILNLKHFFYPNINLLRDGMKQWHVSMCLSINFLFP